MIYPWQPLAQPWLLFHSYYPVVVGKAPVDSPLNEVTIPCCFLPLVYPTDAALTVLGDQGKYILDEYARFHDRDHPTKQYQTLADD